MRRIIFLAIVLFSIANLSGQSTLERAQNYLKAYQNLDFKTMKTLYHDEAEFIDPTFYLLNSKGFYVKGKENIIKTLSKGFQGTKQWKLDITHLFENGNFVVVSGRINSKVAGSVWGRPDKKELVFNHAFVTILKFKNGKVIEHRDYINYVEAGQQLRNQ